MSGSFDKYAKYYDLLYQDKNYASEANYILGLLEEFSHPNTSVLEFGSGTGIHGRLISETGRFVHGIELSPSMAARSVQTESFKVTVGDISSEVVSESFGAVIALFHVMSYITEPEKLVNVFKNANNHLESGGCFIFDAWYSPAVEASPPELRVKRMLNEATEVFRVAEPTTDPKGKIVKVDYTVFIKEAASSHYEKFEEQHVLHHFDVSEVLSIANETGFKLIGSEEFLTREKPSASTWGVCFILQKID
jgi:SAM-dependent methyltransferase